MIHISALLDDVKRYAPSPDEAAIVGIVKYLGIALRSRDASLVSCSDDNELARIRDGFCMKKLGLSKEAAEAAVKAVCEMMKDERIKPRITFYYLLARETGTLNKLTGPAMTEANETLFSLHIPNEETAKELEKLRDPEFRKRLPAYESVDDLMTALKKG